MVNESVVDGTALFIRVIHSSSCGAVMTLQCKTLVLVIDAFPDDIITAQ